MFLPEEWEKLLGASCNMSLAENQETSHNKKENGEIYSLWEDNHMTGKKRYPENKGIVFY